MEKKGKTSSKVESNYETLQLKNFADVPALLLSDDEMVQESDDEEVFTAREEIDEDIPPTDEEAQSLPPNTNKHESSHAQETNQSDSNSFCPNALWKYDNTLPLTKIQLVKYLQKDTMKRMLIHREQNDKLIQETMDCLDKNSTNRSNLLKALNGVTETLKVIQDAVKEDLALNKKVLEAIGAYTANSNNITELLSLAKTFDFSGLKSLVETVKAALDAQNDHLETWAKHSKADTEEPPSHTEGENDDMQTEEDKAGKEQELERPTRAFLISAFRPLMRINPEVEMMTSPSIVKLTHTVLKIPTLDPDEPIRVPYRINGKMHYLTNDEINAHMEKEEQIKKAAEEAKMFAITKTEVIKVVREEAEKIGLNPKTIVNSKEGKKFKKAQDVEHQVLKRDHSQKVKRLMELNKKRVEQYM
ncbi:hypothetical protein Tco_1025822 [Tanacetum coccineum]